MVMDGESASSFIRTSPEVDILSISNAISLVFCDPPQLVRLKKRRIEAMRFIGSKSFVFIFVNDGCNILSIQ